MKALPWTPWLARVRAAESIEEMQGDRKLHYEPAFEGLRSVLLLLVIVSHGQSYLLHLDGTVLVKGFGIMPMFFVLSGFLVGSIVLTSWERTRTIGFGKYARRRITRLGAPVLLYVIVHFIVAVAIGTPLFSYGRTLGELWSDLTILTFTSNLVPSFGHQVPYDAGQMWSLGVDMQLYFLLPFVILFFLTKMNRPWAIVKAGVIVAVVVHVIRYLEFHHFYGGEEMAATTEGTIAINSVYQRPETSVDAFVIGFVLLVLWRRDLLPVQLFRRLSLPMVLLFGVIVLSIPLKGPLAYSVGYPFVLVCACVALSESLRGESRLARILGSYPLRLIGRISFTLYIWHLFVFSMVSYWLPESAGVPVRFLIGLVSLVVVSVIAWWLAERPLLRLPPVGRPTRPEWLRSRRRVDPGPAGAGEAVGSGGDPL